jgi:hypothetical protein
MEAATKIEDHMGNARTKIAKINVKAVTKMTEYEEDDPVFVVVHCDCLVRRPLSFV